MKIIGVGLNRTGTKSLRRHCLEWGFRHRSYELEAFERYRRGEIEALLEDMEDYDSFEDWPWPLFYREIDERFPDAKFVLTTRRTPEVWYQSLCHLAVRMGPFVKFEQHIYGYKMPHGHRDEHIDYYLEHNEAVRKHFADRPGKLLEICWETDPTSAAQLANFLGQEESPPRPAHANRSSRRVYRGDNLWVAHANRIVFQRYWYTKEWIKKHLPWLVPILRPLLPKG